MFLLFLQPLYPTDRWDDCPLGVSLRRTSQDKGNKISFNLYIPLIGGVIVHGVDPNLGDLDWDLDRSTHCAL